MLINRGYLGRASLISAANLWQHRQLRMIVFFVSEELLNGFGSGSAARPSCAIAWSEEGSVRTAQRIGRNHFRWRRDARDQRGQGRQPGGLRRDEQAAGDDGVGVRGTDI